METMFWIISVVIVIYLIVNAINNGDKKIKSKNEELQSTLKKNQKNREEVFQIIADKYEMPSKTPSFTVHKWPGHKLNRSIKGYFWRQEDILKILSFFDYNLMTADINNIEYDKLIYDEIRLEDIQFYFNTGNFYTENKIQGGGGGGSSIGNAVVGGVLFGGAGAVIGSRKSIDPVTSKLLIHDTRETVIKIIINGDDKFIHMSFDEMRYLYSLLPGKSIDELNNQKN